MCKYTCSTILNTRKAGALRAPPFLGPALRGGHAGFASCGPTRRQGAVLGEINAHQWRISFENRQQVVHPCRRQPYRPIGRWLLDRRRTDAIAVWCWAGGDSSVNQLRRASRAETLVIGSVIGDEEGGRQERRCLPGAA